MTALEHLNLAKEYLQQSIAENRRATAGEHFNWAAYQESQRLYKLHNKHYGIWRALETKANKRLLDSIAARC